jgi:monoamine oxidase
MSQNNSTTTQKIYDVILIGAGMAGLKAAYDLQNKGLSVIVLEARDRIGGRIHTTTEFDAEFPIDLGAELVHTKVSPTWELINSQNLKTTKLINDSDKNKSADLVGFQEFFQALESKKIPYPKSAEDILSYLKRLEAEPQLIQEIEELTLDTENLDKINALAVLNRFKQMVKDGEIIGANDFKIVGGYKQIYKILAEKLQIKLSKPVTLINWESDECEVGTTDGNVYKSHKIVLTAPVAVLKKQNIKFVPELPEAKKQAIESFGVCDIVKIFLKFDEKILTPDVNILNVFEDEIPVWWKATITADENYKGEILVGWLSADKARKLYTLSKDEIIDVATKDLEKKLNKTNLKPVKSLVQIWKDEEFSLGAYSYIPAQVSPDIIEDLAKPIDNKIFWAGEATDPNYATVQGAYYSGKRVATEIYNSFNLK